MLDSPAGYADTAFIGSPRLQELAESLTSASNRVLLFAISDADLRRFTGGDAPEFRRYMLVATPRSMEGEHLGAPAFRRMTEEATRDLRALPPGIDIAKHLQGQPVGLTSALAELRRDPAVVSLLQGTRLPPTGVPRMFGSEERQNYMLSSNTLMLLHGKALHVSVFSLYESAEDATWVRAVTGRWVEDLQRLNGR